MGKFVTAGDVMRKKVCLQCHGVFDTQFLCPKCGDNDGYLNVGEDHWFVCHAHRVKWLVGDDRFSFPEQDDWEANRKLLEGYEEIQCCFDQDFLEDRPTTWPDWVS